MNSINELYSHCELCPRSCGVDRHKAKGFCGAASALSVARAALHYWEEPCISGDAGSGTVFFTGCQLLCVYCQNMVISSNSITFEIDGDRLCEVFLELEGKGANNINLVTPSHYTPHIIYALKKAKAQGLSIPIVYNCGGYESVDTLRMYDGLVDIYIPDIKTLDCEIGRKYYHASDYPSVVKSALDEMYRQVGSNRFSGDLLTRGMIIRHLVLPGSIYDSFDVIDYVAESFGDRVYLSLMSQYVPMGKIEPFPELNNSLLPSDYERVINYAWGCGLENVYTQDSSSAVCEFIPPFDGEGIIK